MRSPALSRATRSVNGPSGPRASTTISFAIEAFATKPAAPLSDQLSPSRVAVTL
jgi:hypothetical protein